MNDNACRQLDAYLDSDLPSGERRAFVDHMATCPACREAVDEQRWIDELLRSDEATAIEAAPIVPAITVRMRPRRRWLVAAAAATVVLVGTLAITTRTPHSEAVRPIVASVDAPVATAPEVGPRSPEADGVPTAAFVSAGSSIAISVASDSPQVTIVQLYPTVTASRRWEREASLRSAVISPNGG